MAADGLAPLGHTIFPRRLATYVGERFPPVEYGTACVLFFLAAYLAASTLMRHQPNGPAVAVGLATVVLVFFHLRLMDEVKDAEHDAAHFPDRPVPRGLIALGEIRALIAITIAIELVANAALSPAALAAYLAVLAFTLLMYREFFVGEQLRSNFLVYTLVHMPSLPLLAAYAYVLAQEREWPAVDPAFGLFLVATYAIGLSLEIARKLHAPADEPSGVYTYTKHLGTGGASALLVGLVGIIGISSILLGAALGWGLSYAGPIVALSAVAIAGVVRFGTSPSRAAARAVERVFIPVAALGPYVLTLVHALLGSSA